MGNDAKQGTADTSALTDVFSGMLAAHDLQGDRFYECLKDLPRVKRAIEYLQNGDPEYFAITLQYPFRQFLEALVREAIKKPLGDAVWLLTNYQYVEGHFSNAFTRVEGSACSVDKARWCVSRLLQNFSTGEHIVRNLDQQYTYHLPKKVLTDHQDIIDFYEAIKSMFYGDPLKYVAMLPRLELGKETQE